MEKYCKKCDVTFSDSNFNICPYCGTSLESIHHREPIPRKLRHEVFQRDGYRCRECGASKDEATLEIDHILPVAKGGTNDIDNLQTLCRECNRKKYTDEWVGGETDLEIANNELALLKQRLIELQEGLDNANTEDEEIELEYDIMILNEEISNIQSKIELLSKEVVEIKQKDLLQAKREKLFKKLYVKFDDVIWDFLSLHPSFVDYPLFEKADKINRFLDLYYEHNASSENEFMHSLVDDFSYLDRLKIFLNEFKSLWEPHFVHFVPKEYITIMNTMVLNYQYKSDQELFFYPFDQLKEVFDYILYILSFFDKINNLSIEDLQFLFYKYFYKFSDNSAYINDNIQFIISLPENIRYSFIESMKEFLSYNSSLQILEKIESSSSNQDFKNKIIDKFVKITKHLDSKGHIILKYGVYVNDINLYFIYAYDIGSLRSNVIKNGLFWQDSLNHYNIIELSNPEMPDSICDIYEKINDKISIDDFLDRIKDLDNKFSDAMPKDIALKMLFSKELNS